MDQQLIPATRGCDFCFVKTKNTFTTCKPEPKTFGFTIIWWKINEQRFKKQTGHADYSFSCVLIRKSHCVLPHFHYPSLKNPCWLYPSSNQLTYDIITDPMPFAVGEESPWQIQRLCVSSVYHASTSQKNGSRTNRVFRSVVFCVISYFLAKACYGWKFPPYDNGDIFRRWINWGIKSTWLTGGENDRKCFLHNLSVKNVKLPNSFFSFLVEESSRHASIK